jgi:signal transduction histidine kinase
MFRAGALDRQRILDAGLGGALLVIGETLIATGAIAEGSRWVTAPCAAVVSAAVVGRRTMPVAAAAVAVAWDIQAVLAISPTSIWALVTFLILAFSAGAYADLRPALLGGGLLLVAAYVSTALDPGAGVGDRLFTAPVLTGAPWIAGRVVRRYFAQAHTLDVLNRELERRRADDVRAATQQERARIARELHDVVAHSISVMVVQAGAAGLVLDTDPQAVHEPLEQIRRTGKSALLEMRRLLGVLRSDDHGLVLGPQPGVADLPALVENMRAAGLAVTMSADDDLPPLPAGCDLAAYRVIQEALTNALKHAPTGKTVVRLQNSSRGIELDVLTTGPAKTTRGRIDSDGQGHGLIGMRERVALYGGRIDAGPVNGGWRVTAVFPSESLDLA